RSGEQPRRGVPVTAQIEPLTTDEPHPYVNHRLRHASGAPPLTFSRPVTDVIHIHSRGVARMINVISDAVLLYGYGSDKRVIDLELVTEVVNDLGLSNVRPSDGETGRKAPAEQAVTAPPPAVSTPADEYTHAPHGVMGSPPPIDCWGAKRRPATTRRAPPAPPARWRAEGVSLRRGRGVFWLQRPPTSGPPSSPPVDPPPALAPRSTV